MSVAEEQRSEASEGEPEKRNTGRIEEIQGVVIEAVFPDKLPEINHAIAVRRPEVAAKEEEIDVAADEDPWLVCEVQQHLGDDRVRAVAMDTTDGLSRGIEVIDTGAPITVPVGEITLGRIFNLLGEPIDLGDELPDDVQALADPPRRAERRGADADDRDVRDRDQGHRPARPLCQGRQGRTVRRRRRGQDRDHPGADPQPGRGARGTVGLLRRGRALARGQRPVAGDEGIRRAREDHAGVRPDERAARAPACGLRCPA